MSDAAEKKKPGLALVISMGKGKKGADEEEGDEMEGDDEDYSASLDELADVLDVPEDKREDFASAFKAACMSCK